MHLPISVSLKGQSLLEVVVLVGLALVIVTGLTIVTINGLKNSQFSQNRAQATRFAQDAIDCIRSIKDQNKPIKIDTDTYYWYDASATKLLIWAAPANTFPNTFKILNPPPAQSCVGLQNAAFDNSLPTALKSTFTRTINMEDYGGASQKKVTVVVSWTDVSGTHNSTMATVIAKN